MGAQKCPPSPNVRSARCELGRSSVHAAFEAPRETRGASLLAATLLAATLEVAERSDQVIERGDELLNWAAAIEQTGDRAQQIAEQIAGPRLRDDVDHERIRQIDDQPQQVEMNRSDHEIQNRTRGLLGT